MKQRIVKVGADNSAAVWEAPSPFMGENSLAASDVKNGGR